MVRRADDRAFMGAFVVSAPADDSREIAVCLDLHPWAFGPSAAGRLEGGYTPVTDCETFAGYWRT